MNGKQTPKTHRESFRISDSLKAALDERVEQTFKRSERQNKRGIRSELCIKALELFLLKGKQ